MDLISVPFDDLANHNCALVDSTTFEILIDGAISWFLVHSGSSRAAAADLRQRFGITPDELNLAIDLLARFVVYDFVVVDAGIVERRYPSSGNYSNIPLARDFVRSTDVPKEVYVGAARNVVNATRSIGFDPHSDDFNSDQYTWLMPRAWADGVGKSYIDELYDRVREISWIANSDQTAVRAFFYLDVARFASIPIFLTAEKQRSLIYQSTRVLTEALRIIERRVDRAVFDNLAAGATATSREFELPCPPLSRYLLSVASRERISLYEAMLRVRELPAAAGFRSWLGQLQRWLLDDTSTASLMRAEKVLGDLATIAEQWGDECDSRFGVRFKKVKADLSVIPPFASILRFFGKTDAAIKDPIIGNSPPHLTFIASWYDALAEEEGAV